MTAMDTLEGGYPATYQSNHVKSDEQAFILPPLPSSPGFNDGIRPLATLCMLWSDTIGWRLEEPCADVADRLRSQAPAPEWLRLLDVYAGRRVDGAIAVLMLDVHARLTRTITSRIAHEVPELIFTDAIEVLLCDAMSKSATDSFVIRSAIVFEQVNRCHLVLEASLGPATLLTNFSPAVLSVGQRANKRADNCKPRELALAPHRTDLVAPFPSQILIRYRDDRPLRAVPAAAPWSSCALNCTLSSLAEDCGFRTSSGLVELDELVTECEQGDVAEMLCWMQPTLIKPIALIRRGAIRHTIHTGNPGPVLIRLWRRLSAMYRGQARDTMRWMHVVR